MAYTNNLGQTRLGWRPGIPPNPFKMTIDTTQPGSASNTFILPCGNLGTYNATIDWGDGTTSEITSYNDANLTHTYSVGGTYQISIVGDLPYINFNYSGDKLKLISIDKWGANKWLSMQTSFGGCENMSIPAIDVPDFSLCTSFYRAFNLCYSLTTLTNANQWDMSSAVVLRSMFDNCGISGHLDLSGWQLTSCSDLGTGGSFPFMKNTNITSLDVSNWNFRPAGTSLNYFIVNCDSLTTITGLNTWQTPEYIKSMTGFINSCALLTSIDLSGLDLSSCSSFQTAFYNNSSLTNINLSGVTLKSTGTISMDLTFALNPVLTTIAGIESFNTSAVNKLRGTFKNSGLTGDLDLTSWDVSSNTTLDSTFMQLTSLNSLDISGWDCGNVTTWGAKFSACFYGSTISTINVSNISLRLAGVNLQYAFFASGTVSNIVGLDTWDISTATVMTGFMQGGKLTTIEYDKVLVAWDTLIDAPDGFAVNFGSSQYTLGGSAETSRNNLINTDLWTITDSGGI